MSNNQKQSEVKTKKIKARILDASGDLVFGIIDVPMNDPRPEWEGGRLNEPTNVGQGNPEGSKAGSIKGF